MEIVYAGSWFVICTVAGRKQINKSRGRVIGMHAQFNLSLTEWNACIAHILYNRSAWHSFDRAMIVHLRNIVYYITPIQFVVKIHIPIIRTPPVYISIQRPIRIPPLGQPLQHWSQFSQLTSILIVPTHLYT